MESKNKVGVAIYSDKMDFKPTKIKRQRKALHNGKGINQQEELTILNRYAPKTRAPRYIKPVLNDLQRDLDSYTIIVRDFNTPCQY